MNAGKMLKAQIAEIKPGEWYTKINISIFLVDLERGRLLDPVSRHVGPVAARNLSGDKRRF